MCGIAGIAAKQAVSDRGWLQSAVQSLLHRGPDAFGVWWSKDGRVGLGHRRLAIIDLSPAAAQPMSDNSADLHLTFNGEIYNYLELRSELEGLGHRFSSRSDTEVLLCAYKQWGEQCLLRISGMFAFAIYDASKRTLTLARDRAGEKPIYYWLRKGAISFASELKGLMTDASLDRTVAPDSLDLFLGLGFVPGGRSILSHVQKIPPAHFAVYNVDTGSLSIRRYWSTPAPCSPADICTVEELQIQLEAVLQQAVARQLVADVPVGVLLSGGVDSSIVTALAARASTRIKTFTVRFPGGGRHDESRHALRIAEHFGTEHVTLDADESNVDLLPLLARQFDEPLNDSSMVPTYLLSRLVRKYCSVALGGDGADELFGGYTHYDRMIRMRNWVRFVPRHLRKAIARGSGFVLASGSKGANWIQALGTDFSTEVPLIANYFSERMRFQLLGTRRTATEEFWSRAVRVQGDLIDRATRVDFENYLPEDILVKVDRASMLCSLEIRAPMLDHSVIDFAFSKVPSRYKTTAVTRKLLLRGLSKKLLPFDFDSGRKQGFSIPIANWLESGPWLTFFREVLMDSGQTTFHRSAIERLFKGQRAGHANGERLFGLVMFELWRREYRVSC